MTVKQLIAKLKKVPQDLTVYISDHDHSEWEVSGSVRNVTLVNKSDMSFDEFKNHTSTKDTLEELSRLPQTYISIRP